MMPASLALIMEAYPVARERAGAIAIWSLGGAVASAVGPVLGGVLSLVSWRMIFVINLPLGLVALLLLARITRSPRQLVRFDWSGQLAAIVGMAALIYGVIEGGAVGFDAPQVLAMLAVAVLAIVVFFVTQARGSDPMVPPDLFRSRPVVVSISVGFAFMVGFYGMVFLISLYLQQTRGLSALETGLAFLPMTVLVGFMNILAARIAARFGPNVPIAAGQFLMAVGLVALVLNVADAPTSILAVLMIPVGLGGALSIPPMIALLLDSAPAERAGTASGVLNTARHEPAHRCGPAGRHRDRRRNPPPDPPRAVNPTTSCATTHQRKERIRPCPHGRAPSSPASERPTNSGSRRCAATEHCASPSSSGSSATATPSTSDPSAAATPPGSAEPRSDSKATSAPAASRKTSPSATPTQPSTTISTTSTARNTTAGRPPSPASPAPLPERRPSGSSPADADTSLRHRSQPRLTPNPQNTERNTHMRATLMYGAGDVRIETVPDARIEQPTDAVVRVIFSCICGSDLWPYGSRPASEHGQQMGHEFLGVVEDLGSDVSGFARSDVVVVPFVWADNTCDYCAEGLQTSCRHGGRWGGVDFNGGQAEAVRVPQAQGTLVKLPVGEDSPLLPSLLTLSDVLSTGHHSAVKAGVRPGSTVTVIGDGAVGLSAVIAAKRLGAERILLMGRHEARTNLGREFGATDVIVQRGEEGVARLRELTGGDGTPYVLECVGTKPAIVTAFGVARDGGVVSRVGAPQYPEVPMDFGVFMRNITLTGGVAPARAYIEELMPDILNGTIQPGRVFDRTVTLDGVPDGYRAMADREALKVLVRA